MAKKILSKEQIRKIADTIAREAKKDKINISKVLLFGSYAKNRATADSDLDLCFISSDFKDTFKAEVYLRSKIHNLFDNKTAIDVVAYSPNDFKMSIPLIFEIRETGKQVL